MWYGLKRILAVRGVRRRVETFRSHLLGSPGRNGSIVKFPFYQG